MSRPLHGYLKKGTLLFLLPGLVILMLGHLLVSFLVGVFEVETQLEGILNDQSQRIGSLLNSQKERLQFYQRTRRGIPTSDDLTALIQGTTPLGSVYLADPDAIIIAATDSLLKGRVIEDSDVFVGARTIPLVRPLAYDVTRNLLTATVAVSWNFGGNRMGVLVGEVLPSKIKDILVSNPADPYRVFAFAPPTHGLLPVPGYPRWDTLPTWFQAEMESLFLQQENRGLRFGPMGDWVVSASRWNQSLGLGIWVEKSVKPGNYLFHLHGYYFFFSLLSLYLLFHWQVDRFRPKVETPLRALEQLIRDISARRPAPTFPRFYIQEFQDLSAAIKDLYNDHFQSSARVISNEAYFSRLIQHSADYILLLSFEGRIQYASPSLQEAFNLGEKDLFAKLIQDVIPIPPTKWFALVNNLMNGQTLNHDRYLVTYNGATRILDARFSLMPGTQTAEPQVVMNAHDITEYENLTKALAKKEKLETIYQFSGGVAHDFSNLLMGMLGHLSVAQIKLERGEGSPLAEIRNVQAEILRTRDLIQSLIAVSQGGVFRLESLELEPLILAAWDPYAASNRLTLQKVGVSNAQVEADREKTLAVLEELFSNAVYFMGGSGVITVNCRRAEKPLPLDPEHSANWLELSIIDSGPGMNENQLQRVFEPYFSSRGTGRGLGLAMVYSVMEAMGGFVEVESRPGLGTSVNLYFSLTPKPR